MIQKELNLPELHLVYLINTRCLLEQKRALSLCVADHNRDTFTHFNTLTEMFDGAMHKTFETLRRNNKNNKFWFVLRVGSNTTSCCTRKYLDKEGTLQRTPDPQRTPDLSHIRAALK